MECSQLKKHSLKSSVMPDEHSGDAKHDTALQDTDFVVIALLQSPGWDTCVSSPHLCIQFHDVSYFVPAKSHKAPVILRAVLPHNDVWLKVCFPLHTIGSGGCSPLGKICWRMPFRPDVVPATDINSRDVGRQLDRKHLGELTKYYLLEETLKNKDISLQFTSSFSRCIRGHF